MIYKLVSQLDPQFNQLSNSKLFFQLLKLKKDSQYLLLTWAVTKILDQELD